MPKCILGPNTEGVTRGWRKWHNKELHDPQSSLNIINTSQDRKKAVRMSEKVHMHCFGGKPESTWTTEE